MKLKKLVVTVVIAAVLAGCLVGCGYTEGSGTVATGSGGSDAIASGTNMTEETREDGSDMTGGTTAAGMDTLGETMAAGSDMPYCVDWEDMAELNMVTMCTGAVPNGLQEVEDAVNEITEIELNTHVNLEMIEMGSYIQQISLKMSSGEPVDILLTFPAGAASFTGMVNSNQLMDITDLIKEYGRPILDTVGQYMEATTVEGRIRSIPIYRNIVTNLYMVMRTDVLEDLGLLETAKQADSLKSFEEVFEAVKSSSQWNYLSCLAPGGGTGGILINSNGFVGIHSFGDNVLYDPLGSDYLVGADVSGNKPQVRLVTEMPAYRELIELTHEWYEKGYIYKDSATDGTMASELVKANTVFGYLTAGELGAESASEQSCGMPMTCVKLLTLPITTSSCTKFTWAVPNASQSPEAAVTFLSMMYTDSRINNLLAWGIEGRDYVVENGVAKYPDGITEPLYHTADFIVGNQFITIPWEGTPEGFRTIAREEMAAADISPWLGFTCNTDSISTELAAITNVVSEYEAQVNSGIANPSKLDEFIEKLKASNVQRVIDTYQTQLNDWIEGNHI